MRRDEEYEEGFGCGLPMADKTSAEVSYNKKGNAINFMIKK